MDAHPLTYNPPLGIPVVASGTVLAGIQAALLIAYADVPVSYALADGILGVALLGALAYLMWFVIGYVNYPSATLLANVLALLLWLAGCFAIQSGIEWVATDRYIPFYATLPFRITMGVLCWTSVTLWYKNRILQYRIEQLEGEIPFDEQRQEEASGTSTAEEQTFTRITVKDGTRIHLIEVEKLLYIQACGDYVTLIDPNGQYVKEQTMRYFDQHLPKGLFVRIHRSTIVNVTQISRVELFGKENYRLLLKNGTQLKVSLSGYKLLKENLNL